MDWTSDQMSAFVAARYKDKPHADYSKDIAAWNRIHRKAIEILELKNYDPVRIWDISITSNVLRIEFSTKSDIEYNYRQVFVCDSSYLDLDFYSMRLDYGSLEADVNAIKKQQELERQKKDEYRQYLRLREKFDPDFVRPEDY